ncbi:Glycosylphosphatidylinositol (GPI) anchor assembly protein [Trapelia coarctata]|nr:Glycosylphosphatidylinositol (GPI) anchor assembly protein [Trapelia coarctata]
MTNPPIPKSRTINPTSQPITLLSTPTARTFAHLHPVLLSAYYYLHFSSLVATPVPTLFADLVPLSLLQLAYAITCLPPTKSISTTATPAQKTKTGKPKRAQRERERAWEGLPSKLSTALLALTLTLLSTPPLTTILILFGAPLTTHLSQTVLLAAHISLLALFPLFYAHGVNSTMWLEIAGVILPFDEVWGATVGTLLGAWLGAVPIPLDWDRGWQVWPVTVVTGAWVGAVVGRGVGGLLVRGRRVRFD